MDGNLAFKVCAVVLGAALAVAFFALDSDQGQIRGSILNATARLESIEHGVNNISLAIAGGAGPGFDASKVTPDPSARTGDAGWKDGFLKGVEVSNMALSQVRGGNCRSGFTLTVARLSGPHAAQIQVECRP